MSKQGYYPGQTRGQGGGTLARADQVPDDERPFAELRKNLQDVLRMLTLHRWAFFVISCIVASGAFVLSLYYPRTYQAQTSFERRNDPILADLKMSQGAATFRLFRTTVSRDLRSKECMAEVVERIGLTENFERNPDGTLAEASVRRRDTLALALADKISISTRSPNEHTDVVNITYTGPDPAIGKKLLDVVKETYIRRTKAWVQDHLLGLREYYVAETAKALSVLRGAERKQTAMRLDNPLVNPQNPAAVSQRLAQLEMAGKELQQRRSEYQADLNAQKQLLASVEARMNAPSGLANQGADFSEPTFLSPEAIRLTSLIDAADAKIAELRTVRRMTDEHPEIMELLATRRSNMAALEAQRDRDRQLAVANGVLDVRLMSLVGGTEPWRSDRARLFVQIAAQEAKIKDVDISLQANEREVGQLTDVKARVFEIQDSYADITDEVGRAKREHGLLADTLAKVQPAIRANEQNKLLHWSVGQPAQGGAVPVKPTARIVVLLAIFAGLAAGAIFVILAEVLDNVYRSAGRVSRSLGLPILDAIDEIVTSRDRRRALVRRTVVTPIVVGLCLSLTMVTGSVAYLSIQQPHTYKRVQEIPRAAFELFAGTMPPKKLPEPSSPLVES